MHDSISFEEMEAIEKNAKYIGLSYEEMMENAGREVAEEVDSRDNNNNILLFCGKGNNGGDGFVAARYLSEMGYNVLVILVGNEKSISDGATRKNWNKLKKSTVDLIISEDPEFYNKLQEKIKFKPDIIIDAILGTGIKGNLREPVKSAVNSLKNFNANVISVDVPTGFNTNIYDLKSDLKNSIKRFREETKSNIKECVNPDMVVTFHKMKNGMEFIKSNERFAGDKKPNPKIKVADIGIPPEAETYTGPGDIVFLNKREKNSHKGENGRVAILGGGEYTGAPALASMASLRFCSDVCTIVTKKEVSDVIASFSPNLIVKGVEEFDDSLDILKKHDAIVVGPGIGNNKEDLSRIRKVLQKLSKSDVPTVIDADALSLISSNPEIAKNNILTPHEGEFKNLFGIGGDAKNVSNKADALKCTIIKKGVKDIISNGKKLKINKSGSPGMTVGGTGDVLAGAIGGTLSQNPKAPFRSTVAAAFIVGKAGELAQKEYGNSLLATDVIDKIAHAMSDVISSST